MAAKFAEFLIQPNLVEISDRKAKSAETYSDHRLPIERKAEA